MVSFLVLLKKLNNFLRNFNYNLIYGVSHNRGELCDTEL